MARRMSGTAGTPTARERDRGAPGKRKPFAGLVPSGSSATIIAVTIDVASASIAVAVGVWWSSRMDDDVSPWTAAFFVPVVVILLVLQSFYRRRLHRRFVDQLGTVETSIALASILPLSVATLGDLPGLPGSAVSRIWISAAVLMPALRLLHAAVKKRQRRFNTPTLIVGSGEVATRVIERLSASPEYGLHPIGIIDVDPSCADDVTRPLNTDVPVLGPPDAIDDVIRRTGARAMVITFSPVRDALLTRVVQVGHRHNMRVWAVPRMFDVVGERAFVEHIGGLPLLALPHTDPHGVQFTVKHILDRIAAALGLLVISPLFIGLIVLVRLSSPGPIFFRQDRIGRDGKVFECLKFRTMRPPSPSDAEFTPASSSAPGGVEGEDRRTAVGKIMRSTSLDELPQLINVLRGR